MPFSPSAFRDSGDRPGRWTVRLFRRHGHRGALCDAVVMSEEGRLGLSGPEVIEASRGVEEFDSRDRALVWRTVGGKHRYLLGDATLLVEDTIPAFREAALALLGTLPVFGLEDLEAEHARLRERLERFGDCRESIEIWTRLGSRIPRLCLCWRPRPSWLGSAESGGDHGCPKPPG